MTLLMLPFASAVAVTSCSFWLRFGEAQVPGWMLMRCIDLGVNPVAVTVMVYVSPLISIRTVPCPNLLGPSFSGLAFAHAVGPVQAMSLNVSVRGFWV